MHWELLIPIIAFVVFILSRLLRKPDEEVPAGRPAPRPLEPGPRPEPRPATEVERFLEEIERRRRLAQQRAEPRPEPPPRPTPAPPVVVPRRVSVEMARNLPEVEPVVVAVETAPTRPVRVPPEDMPVARPASPEPPAPPPPPPPPPPAATVQQVRRPSPTARKAAALLRTPEALRAAILVHEILGPPRCRRPLVTQPIHRQ